MSLPDPAADRPAGDPAWTRIFGRRGAPVKYNLDATLAFAEWLGRPDRAFAALHVAGTNGKGTVCAALEAIALAAGLPVGLNTSPHLIHYRERFRIGGQAVSDAELAALAAELEVREATMAAAGKGNRVSFFEFTTLLAFELFRRRGVRLGVVEVGLGGRLDATNILEAPLACAITSISKDHIKVLGGTLEAIAREKAGIIKPGRPVVLGRIPDRPRQAIEAVARERGAPCFRAEDLVSVEIRGLSDAGQILHIDTDEGPLPPVALPLFGEAQAANAGLAVATARVAFRAMGLPLPAETLAAGLERIDWPARTQVLARDPLVLLDGAHNPGGARALRRVLGTLRPGPRRWALVFTCLADKHLEGWVTPIRSHVGACWAVGMPDHPRGQTARALAARLRGLGLDARGARLDRAVAAARAWARDHDGAVCIAGSLYLAGDVLERRDELLGPGEAVTV